MDDARARAVDAGHIPTLANTTIFTRRYSNIDEAITEAVWRDAERASMAGDSTELPAFCVRGHRFAVMPASSVGDRKTGIAELQRWPDRLTSNKGIDYLCPTIRGCLPG